MTRAFEGLCPHGLWWFHTPKARVIGKVFHDSQYSSRCSLVAYGDSLKSRTKMDQELEIVIFIDFPQAQRYCFPDSSEVFQTSFHKSPHTRKKPMNGVQIRAQLKGYFRCREVATNTISIITERALTLFLNNNERRNSEIRRPGGQSNSSRAERACSISLSSAPISCLPAFLHSCDELSDKPIRTSDFRKKTPVFQTMQQSLHTESEQKKPRRKDTPAIHIPPFIPGVLTEHLLQTSDIQEKPSEDGMVSQSHNPNLEQKKPRRKDTPALHAPHFASGTRLLRGERHKVILEDEEKEGENIPV
ncbi:protein phosphatase 1 regulatory subunit 17 [Tachyglossus aculeatus]|uniref:protein phosphatase 1 regulatory subunit 17 n=1 Tax=Tachyglossus aculeatus TaxID=9261 RepID=UPI0018F7A67F|nr:protein phosphatase 1 regulatory subunit 17 [Tachyglossus aculeatus]